MTSSTTTRAGCCGGAASAPSVRAGNAAASSACSCGGSCGGTCSCGGSAGQAFARPRFFAGQLLTEDDLDLLATYVVEKNRLHNRSFFGEGVVCGLAVTCDPCGGGKVTVQPGHALDCCGNDILLTCAQSLDINALVRRLRIERNGGVDCGDPCTAANNAPVKATGTVAGTQAPAPSTGGDYCLYVRYAEQMTDAVSPYSTDDPCGSQACEPTRIREGFSFELRCRTCEDDTPDNLFTRISTCLGKLVTTERAMRNSRSAFLYASALEPAIARVAVADPKALVNAQRLDGTSKALASIGTLPSKPEIWSADNVYVAADTAQTLAGLVAAWSTMSDADRRTVDSPDQVAASVTAAQSGLDRLAAMTAQVPVERLVADPFDRDVVTITTQRSLLWAAPESAIKVVPPAESQLLGAGIVYNAQLKSSLSLTLARVKATLVDRLGKRGASTDCTLLRDVQAIQIPDEDPATGAGTASALGTRDATHQLVDVLMRYMRECLCGAINPPCPSCDDPAVMLACVHVEGCEVTGICNLERSFVLTPVAARYWMPFLRSIGDVLERMCCPNDPCASTPAPSPSPQRPKIGPRLAAFSAMAPAPAFERGYVERRSALPLADMWMAPGQLLDPERLAAALPTGLSFSGDDARNLALSAASMLDLASLRSGVVPGDLLASLAPPPAPSPASGARGPTAVAPAGDDVASLRRDVDRLMASLAAADERNKKLDARLKKLGG
jgi:hypothetical protein